MPALWAAISIAVVPNALAQDSSFAPMPNVSASLAGVMSVELADLDGDGDQDLLVATGVNGEVLWFESDGDRRPSFVTAHTIDNDVAHAMSASAADVDGDGDLDIIASVQNASAQAVWYRNLGGLPPVFEAQVLGPISPGNIGNRINSARAADIDGDGDTDVIVSYYVDQNQTQGYVVWYESDGGVLPTFSANAMTAPSGTLENVLELQIADLNGDGFMDIAAVSETPGILGGRNRVVWWRSDGAVNPVFQFLTIDSTIPDPVSLSIGDFAGNSSVDIAVAFAGDDSVIGFVNDGNLSPVFAPSILLPVTDPQAVVLADIENDGDVDMVVAQGGGLEVSLFENQGGVNPFFAQRTLGAVAGFCNDVAVGDLSNSGELDIAAVFSASGVLDWFRQVTPIENTSSGTQHSTFESAIASAIPNDILTAAPNRYGDDPQIDFTGKAIQITSTGAMILSDHSSLTLADGAILQSGPGSPVDIRGDISNPAGSSVEIISGYDAVIRSPLDIFGGSELTVQSDLNLYGDRVLSRTVIDGDADLGTFQQLIGRPVDMQGITLPISGDMGVVVVGDESGGGTLPNPAGLAVYFPDALSPSGWTGVPIDAAAPGKHGPLAVADFNGDGRQDIATVRNFSGASILRLHIAQNLIVPTYTSHFGATAVEAQQLVPEDIDRDGDIDIVSGQGWFRNNGAANPTFTFIAFPLVSSQESFGVVVCDFDLDGNRDVAIHSEKLEQATDIRIGYELYIMVNDGNPSPGFIPILLREQDNVANGTCSGEFDCYPLVNADLAGTNTLSREDEDKDSWTDLYMSEDQGIILFTNPADGSFAFSVSSIDTQAKFCNIVPVDVDGDHDIDILVADTRASRIETLVNHGPSGYLRGGAIRPVLRASALAILGHDAKGVAQMAFSGTASNRIEIADYGDVHSATVGAASQLTVGGSLLIERYTVSMNGGQLTSPGSVIVSPNCGQITGSGIVASSVENAGLLRPRGDLVIAGNLDQQSPMFPDSFGCVEVELRSHQPLDIDRVQVGGAVSLSGGLVALAGPSFTPAVGVALNVVTANDIDDAAPRFDVVHVPNTTVIDGTSPDSGSLMPEYIDIAGNSAVNLVPVVIQDPVLDRTNFIANATPSDAVVVDITGGPGGLPDGFADTIIAYESIPGQGEEGGLAVFLGAAGTSDHFQFESLVLYTGKQVQGPVAVEAGDYDGDGRIEIAFGNSLRGSNQTQVFLLEADSSQQIPIFPSNAPPLLIRPGGKIFDLATVDFMPPNARVPGHDGLVGPVGLVVLTDSEDSGVATAAILSGPVWDGCDVDVCDDPDSVDPIDTDGAAATLIEGFCATSNDDDKVVVASNPAASPGMFEVASFDVGDGPTELRADDMTNDGFPDIVTVNYDAGTVSVLVNVVDLAGAGGRGFDEHIELPLRLDPGDPDPLPSSVALADLDDDGDLDIAVVSTNAAGERVVRELRNLIVDTGEVSFATVVDLDEQPDGVPLLVREADLDGDGGGTFLNDDLVVYIDPSPGALVPEGVGIPMHASITSDLGFICVGDVNGDGMLTPADFTAWIAAFNANAPECDQNGDGICSPADFTAWIANYNAGCP